MGHEAEHAGEPLDRGRTHLAQRGSRASQRYAPNLTFSCQRPTAVSEHCWRRCRQCRRFANVACRKEVKPFARIARRVQIRACKCAARSPAHSSSLPPRTPIRLCTCVCRFSFVAASKCSMKTCSTSIAATSSKRNSLLKILYFASS